MKGKADQMDLRSLELKELELLAQIQNSQAQLAELGIEIERKLFDEINALRDKGDDEKRDWIDKNIWEEIAALHEKFQRARSSAPPPSPDQMWRILEEMWHLLLKLVLKAWFLQRMQIPEVPPQPPGPTP